ncbi:sensor histidine kinase [Catenulispora pinisilvae]|uniref:sensor histidine kinase n=1 Tax=Catenulispora pinisilvae TaxID=2705253 RepID=UPI00189196BA|nr:sensor histidine kinase [Catenulispora pinisilvae]
MNASRQWWARIPLPAVDAVIIVVSALDTWVSLSGEGASALVWVLAVLSVAGLVVRRRLPWVALLLTLPANCVLDIVFAPLASLFTLAEQSRNRRLLVVAALASAVASAVPSSFKGSASDPQLWTVIYFAYALTAAAAPVLLGQLVQTQRDLRARLAEIEQAREHEQLLHAQAVVTRERAQLAREMHDVVSHQVSLIAVQAGALQIATQDPVGRDGAQTIRSLAVKTLEELRHMVTLLRASGGRTTELTPQPTLADLQRLVASSGIPAELTGELPASVGTPAQRTVYRTVQEALTNVRKHAPGASATVRLWHGPDAYGVTVANTPATRPSLALPGSQQGLIGLRERAELLDGTLHAGPTADGGYEVKLSVPNHGNSR